MIVLLIVVIAVVGGYLYKQSQVKDGFVKMKVGESVVEVMIRDTMEGRRQGLSGFSKLESDEGMLFVFSVASKYSFWMKGMKFDLDFVWIKDNKIVEITEGVVAPKGDEKPVSVKPQISINKVLEVNKGWVRENKVKVGDKVILDK